MKVKKIFLHDPHDQNSLSNDYITSLKSDEGGKLWIGTYRGGLCRYDPALNKFMNYRHDPKKEGSLSSDKINGLFMDHNKNCGSLQMMQALMK
jgi:ligand-binding sensor domain-containing protein